MPIMTKRHLKDQKSFTLIEIMLVIIIIGILAAMVMPNLVGRSDQARVMTVKADIDANIATALDMFEMDIGRYPEKLEDLRNNPGLGDSWKGPYLKKDPKDPWGRPYQYERGSTEEKAYKICSNGPDETKTEDDLCN